MLTSGDEIDVPYDGKMVKFKVESINPENGKVMFSRKLEDGKKETFIEPSEKITDWNSGFSAPKIEKRKVAEAVPERKKGPVKVEAKEKAPQPVSSKVEFSAGQTVRGYDSNGAPRIENDWKIVSVENGNEFRIERVGEDGKKIEAVLSRSELERLNKSPNKVATAPRTKKVTSKPTAEAPKKASKTKEVDESFVKLSKSANNKIAADFALAGKELEDVANAIAARKKDISLTIRVNSGDINRIKKMADKKGIAYQTYISEVIHKVAESL